MANELKNLFLLTQTDIKRMRKLVHHLERALSELIELKRVTTFDQAIDPYPPHESDLIEEASFVSQQLAFHLKEKNDF
jgi:hypothetical protein